MEVLKRGVLKRTSITNIELKTLFELNFKNRTLFLLAGLEGKGLN